MTFSLRLDMLVIPFVIGGTSPALAGQDTSLHRPGCRMNRQFPAKHEKTLSNFSSFCMAGNSSIHTSSPNAPAILQPDRLGFDIDGVVADTASAFLRIAAKDYGIDWLGLDDIVDFEVENCVDIDAAIIQAIFTRLVEDPVGEGMEPMADAPAVLEKLAAKGPLFFITARPYRQPILDWLQKILSRRAFAQTSLVATGQHDGKAPFLRAQGLHFFIDDRAETCVALEREGFAPIVYQQPWNAGRHCLTAVDSWQAIDKLCFPLN